MNPEVVPFGMMKIHRFLHLFAKRYTKPLN